MALDAPGRRSPCRALRAWLATTFSGLDGRSFAIYCLVLVPFALSRPNVANVVLKGAGVIELANTLGVAYTLTWLRFTPILLAVVAAANRAPQQPWKKLAWVAVALLMGSLIAGILGIALLPLFFARSRMLQHVIGGDPLQNLTRFIGFTFADAVLCSVAVAFVYYVKRSTRIAADLRAEAQKHEQVERENAEARVSLLQAQIEPHFLFNSLASIRRLYETDPARGRAMLRHLSSYLAASLPALRETRSTLGRELALAVAYLNVQKIRMAARLSVEVNVPAELQALPVPPMMLATLVENAIVHGVGPVPGGGAVRIGARRAGDRLVIEVADTGQGLQDTWGTGIGLANIQARLTTEFGTAAACNLQAREGGGATATIELPLRAGAGTAA
jgi:sensor histidine kinase YesM